MPELNAKIWDMISHAATVSSLSVSLLLYITIALFASFQRFYNKRETVLSVAFRTSFFSKLKKIRAWGVNQTSFLMRFRVRSLSNKTNSFPGQGSLLPSRFSSSEPPVPLAGEAWALGPGRPGPGAQTRREWPVPWSEKRVTKNLWEQEWWEWWWWWR